MPLQSSKPKRSKNGDDHPTAKKPKVDNIIKTSSDVVDLKALRSFKVPKKQKKGDNLVVVKVESKEFAEEIQPIIFQGFKCPLSKKEIKFTHAFMVQNDRLQQQYSTKKSELRKVLCSSNSNVSSATPNATSTLAQSCDDVGESFGFVFIKSQNVVEKIAENGLSSGNLQRSLLCKPNQGVSICQYSDIYSCCPVKGGWLVILKYMRGRSYYAAEDENPLDAQPNYDSHVSKTSAINPESMNADKNFHSSQVFCYEYTEDFETLEYPRQVLPYAAVQFFYQNLPKVISRQFGSVFPKENNKTFDDEMHTSPINRGVHKQSDLSQRITIKPRLQKNQNKVGRLRYTRENNKDGYYLASSFLKISGLEDWSVSVDIISYRQSFIAYDLILIPELEIYELGRVSELYDQLNMKLASANCRLTISRDHENLLAGHNTAINYIRIVMTDASRDRTQMARLCSCLKSKAAKIKFPFSENAFCYIFPDGTFARTLGLPEESYLDVNYLHGLVITPGSWEQHLSYLLAGHMDDEDRLVKQIVETSKTRPPLPSLCDDFNVFDKYSTSIEKLPEYQLNPSLLINTVEQQALLQKTRLMQLVKSDEAPLAYLPVDNVSGNSGSTEVASCAVDLTNDADDSRENMESVSEALDSLSESDLQRVLSMTDLAKPYEPDQHLIGLSVPSEPILAQTSILSPKNSFKSPQSEVSPLKPPPPAPSHLVNLSDENHDAEPPPGETAASDEAIRKRLLDIMNSLQAIRPSDKPDSKDESLFDESHLPNKTESPVDTLSSQEVQQNSHSNSVDHESALCSVLEMMTRDISQLVEETKAKTEESSVSPPPPSSLFSNIDIDTRFDTDLRPPYPVTTPNSRESQQYAAASPNPVDSHPEDYDGRYNNSSGRERSRSGGTYHPLPSGYESEESWNPRSRVSVYEPPRNYQDPHDYRAVRPWVSVDDHWQHPHPPPYRPRPNFQPRPYPPQLVQRANHMNTPRQVLDYSEINYSRRRNY